MGRFCQTSNEKNETINTQMLAAQRDSSRPLYSWIGRANSITENNQQPRVQPTSSPPISRTVQHGSTRSTQCCKCAWCVPARGGFGATLLAAACHECRPVLWSRDRPTTPVKTTKDWVSCRVTIVASAPTKLPPNERRGLVGAERWCTTQR